MKYIKFTLMLLLFINGTGAIFGGFSLMQHPDGSGLGMTTDLLKQSPFADFFIPGLVLFIANGIWSLTALILIFLNKPAARFAAYSQGIILLGWIVMQVIFIRELHYFQLVFLAIGFAMVIMGKKMTITQNIKS